MEQKYIISDLVKYKVGGLEFIAEITNTSKYGYCFKGVSDDISGTLYKEFINDIPLTPEILEKNGWKKLNTVPINCNILYKSHQGLTIGYNINSKTFIYDFGVNQQGKIKFIHELQHLLFGLGLNSDMEV